MSDRQRRPRSVLATVWILLVCAAVGSGIGLAIRAVRNDGDGGPRAITVRPAGRGPHSPAALWLFGSRTVRLDPTTLSDARDAGFQGFGSVLGGEGVVYLFDPGTGRFGVVDAAQNRLVQTTVPVREGVRVDVAPVLAAQRNALWLVTGPDRLTRYDLATGSITDVELPTDLVSEAAAGGPPAAGATRVVADDDTTWAVYDLGVTGNPPHTAVVRIAPDGSIAARAALAPPASGGGGRLEPQAVTVGDGIVWIVGRTAVVGLDATSLEVRQTFAVQADASVELHDAAFAAGSLWSYDARSGELLRIGDDGRVRTRVAITDGAPPSVPAPASIVTGRATMWARVRTGATLEQRVTRVDARSGEITGRFVSPPELEIGAIAVSR
jgi:hypothetical protein